MKVDFSKATKDAKPFEVASNQTHLKGSFKKVSGGLVRIKGQLTGTLRVTCDRCAEEFDITLDEHIELKAADYEYASDQEDALDVQEFPNGIIDFDKIIRDEVILLESDYHCCTQCNDLDMEED